MPRFRRRSLAAGLVAALALCGCDGGEVELETEPTTNPPGANREISEDAVDRGDADGVSPLHENAPMRDGGE